MKYHQIIAALTEEPLLITPAAHASLLKLFEEHRQLSAADFKAKRDGVDYCGVAVELPQAELIDGIMHIPIAGPIGMGLDKFEKGAGCVDVADLTEELQTAEEDPNCYAIFLDIDSPGGMYAGTPELADVIAQCEKPVYAFTAGMMCSAAYWLGCACDLVLATKSADIGSIGVYAPFLDQSERYKAAGLKVDVISSGKYKGAGVPGTSLTLDQRENMQERIDEMAQNFYGHVLNNRPDADLDDMQGQVFKAASAEAHGLLDMVVADRDEAVGMLTI